MATSIDHIFREYWDLWELFEKKYFAETKFKILQKIPENLDYYKSVIGYESGFLEYEMELLQKFREYIESSPDEIANLDRFGLLGEQQKVEIQFWNNYKNNPEKVEERLNVYKKAIDIYEDGLKKFVAERNINTSNDEGTDETELPEIELKSQKEQIRLLYDLGVLDYLREKYPVALLSNSQLSQLVGQILKIKKVSAQPTVNALMNEQSGKNYASQTEKTKKIIAHLNGSESK